jgi:hypothetical protein
MLMLMLISMLMPMLMLMLMLTPHLDPPPHHLHHHPCNHHTTTITNTQIECHPYLTQEPLRKYCKQRGIVVQAHGSLGMGAGKLWDDPEVAAVVAESGISTATVLLCWAMQQDIPVIAEASSPKHIAENMAAWALASAERSGGGGGGGGSGGPLSMEQIARLSALNRDEHFCWDPDTIKY